MCQRIVHGFLRDSVYVDGGLVVVHQDGRTAVELALHLVGVADVAGEFAQRAHQPAGFEPHRVQSVRKLAGVLDGLVDLRHRAFGVPCFGHALAVETVPQAVAQVCHGAELLANAVMQIAADSLLFAFADFEQQPLGAPPPHHLAQLMADGLQNVLQTGAGRSCQAAEDDSDAEDLLL